MELSKHFQIKMMKHKLLFICGFPSGGTDLTKTVLNAHPDINVSGEMPFLVELLNKGYDHKSSFSSLEEIEELKEILKAGDTWNNVRNADFDFSDLLTKEKEMPLIEVLRVMFDKEHQLVWGNKTPQNTENIPLLRALFPEAHFLIVTRDVRDTSLSWSRKWGKSMLWCADKWNRRMQQGKRDSQDVKEGKALWVKFEDLLSDPENICRLICSSLDIPFSEQMLEHHKHTNEKLDGKLNYGKALKSDNQNKWESSMSSKKVQRIEEIAFDAMQKLNYSTEMATSRMPITDFELLKGRLNDIYALLFVGNRASEDNTVGYRIKNVIHEVNKRLSGRR